jgi:glycosyltransferase involved in cell wall biosynthesis
MAKREHTVTVYGYNFNQDKESVSDLSQHNVSIVTVRKLNAPFIGKYLAALELLKTLKKSSPNVLLFSGTLPFFLAGKLSGLRIISLYMGTQFDAFLENNLPNQNISLISQILNKIVNIYIYLVGLMLIRFSNGVVAISRYAAKEALLLYKRRVDNTIYLGTTYFQKKIVTKRGNKNTISILSVSRITPYKGFHLIIEALNQVKTKRTIRLIIAGSQPKQRYVEYLKKLGGNRVEIILNPSDKRLSELYQQSDFYVNADRYLYFGLPIMEAAHFHRPTVSLNFAAANELVVHGKTGFVANNFDEFSYYLQKLIENEKLRNKLGYNALQWSKTFSWEKCAKEWEGVMKKVIMVDINHK